MSRREMAKEIGVAKTTLSGWEQGSHIPKLDVLQYFAATCKVSVTWIIGEVDDMNWRPSTTTSGNPHAVHAIREVA